MTSVPSYGEILRKHSVSFKKRLGQNFMLDPALLRAIARCMVPDDGPWVALEIGAGIGTLTRQLSGLASWVYAVEMDRDLEGAMAEACSGIPNLTWIWGNALDRDLTGKDLRRKHEAARLLLCGNLPYYATSEILYNALVKRSCWDRLAFVVQEEVGQRMLGFRGTKDFGRLSLWCQYRAHVSIQQRISPGSFVPRPKVGSCLVTMDVRPEFQLTEDEESLLDVIARAVFSNRRKTVLNGLMNLHGMQQDRLLIGAKLAENGIDPRARPEDLGIEGFVQLVKALEPFLHAAVSMEEHRAE